LSRRLTDAAPAANLQQKSPAGCNGCRFPSRNLPETGRFHDRFDNLHYESGNFWVELPTAAELIP
jgi:hypothetical protein